MTQQEKLTVLTTLISATQDAKKESDDNIVSLTKEVAFQNRLIERAAALSTFLANQLSGLQSDVAAVNAGKL